MREPLTRDEKQQLAESGKVEGDLLADMRKNLPEAKRKINSMLGRPDEAEQTRIHREGLIDAAAMDYFGHRIIGHVPAKKALSSFNAIMQERPEAPDEWKRKRNRAFALIENTVDDPIDAALGRKRDRTWVM